MILQARETTGTVEYPAQEASTQFAVVLMSRENHAPSFGSDLYVGFVAEHSAHLTAVDWAPGVSPKVHDRDQGRNSTFRLYLEGDEDGTFSVHPSSASRETDFTILVQDSSKLDYEVADPKYVEFRLVAAETEAVEPLTSTVTVRVNIVDTNDHPPMFTRDTYEAVVAEDAKKGTLVTTVTATDPDSGSFGRVRYTSLNGPIARNLKLDPETGEVTLTSSEGLDRESVPEYVLVVEAHDDDGRGQRASAQLRIRVGDANDNAPAFMQSRYDAVLTADLADFTEPLVVKATDADAAGPNSNVTYEIVSGNYEQKFRIDARTGLVSLTAPLTSGGKHGYPVVLTVRAHDQGIPVQSASVPVRVHTQEYLNRSIVVVLPGNDAYLKDRKEHVEKGLSELLGANVNIYSITAHNQSKEAYVSQ
ncbi:cadherin-86C [Ixodes scapularis]|uniref:cadherin-86C n=1 Tax=Ixodes scapularis TaxID=6945 RepID=UPI001C38B596|nr:cadherin-86C [Ixodes scapularis]